jgi:ABC-2 type transport system permease protein
MFAVDASHPSAATQAAAHASAARRAAAHAPLRSYLLEAGYEFLRLLRTPSFALPSLTFPPLFYLLFAVLLGKSAGPEAARSLLAAYGVFGVMGAGMFAFGVTVSLERDQGFLDYKRALPMPPGAYLFAKIAMAALFATLIAITLAVLGASVAGVRMAPAQWPLLVLVHILGVVPFAAIGLCIGTVVGGQGAPAVVNLIYLPMAFLSGLLLPLRVLPEWLQQLAPLWPSYHHLRIAQAAAGTGGTEDLALHIGVLVAVTVAGCLFARRRLAMG